MNNTTFSRVAYSPCHGMYGTDHNVHYITDNYNTTASYLEATIWNKSSAIRMVNTYGTVLAYYDIGEMSTEQTATTSKPSALKSHSKKSDSLGSRLVALCNKYR